MHRSWQIFASHIPVGTYLFLFIFPIASSGTSPRCSEAIRKVIETYMATYDAGNMFHPDPIERYFRALHVTLNAHPLTQEIKQWVEFDPLTTVMDDSRLHNALIARIRGQDSTAKSLLDDFYLEGGQANLFPSFPHYFHNYLHDLLIAASQDTEVITHFVHLNDLWTRRDIGTRIEELFVWHLIRSPTFLFLPQHVAATRTIFQYGIPEDSANILEIGYGRFPSILKALRTILPGRGHMIGLDLTPTSQDVLDPELHGITLLSGNPLDHNRQHLSKEITDRGPYRVIFGLNVYRRGYFVSDVTHIRYLQWIRSLLADKGVFIGINDNQAPWVFSKLETELAKLHIVRWSHSLLLSQAERELFYPRNIEENVGHMSVYVLHK